MTRVVVGVDGSPSSRHALEVAVDEAIMRQADLEVVTVAHPHGLAPMIAYAPPPHKEVGEHVDAAREQAQAMVDKALGERQGAPGKVTVQVLVGVPGEELVAATDGADLLVVGRRGVGGFARMVLGSVSNAVVHHAHCPVLVVPAASEG